MRVAFLILLLSNCLHGIAQKNFSDEDLAGVVKKFHPVAKQAYLDVRIAEARLTSSRSAFDPVLNYDRNKKAFENTVYYDQTWNEIKIPTWYGIDLYAGTESIDGSRTNPEWTKGSMTYIGVSVPLLQNLLIDKRRAALRQAKLFKEGSEVTRKLALNDLLAEALHSYWTWWEQHRLQSLIQSSLQNAQRRLEMVKTAVALGDRPAIDTIEALTQVQFFIQKAIETNLNLTKARLELSTFLWTSDGKTFDLPQDVLPHTQPAEENIALDSLLWSAHTHPQLIAYQYTLRSLQIDRQLKFQSFLPALDVKYNQLGRGFSKTWGNVWFQNNYKFGVSLSVPLRLSEARGSYQAVKFKIAQTKLAQANKQIELQNKMGQYYAEYKAMIASIAMQKNLFQNYSLLQRGEETKFLNGESTLFLVNARELKTIEAQQKMIELEAKAAKAQVSFKWVGGLLQ